MNNIYALLIGINGYPTKPLQGCLNDIEEVEKYLQFMQAAKPNGTLEIKKLADSAELPTRENLINAFDFFEPAGDGDFCLVYYSGHGSFSPAPREFWQETDGNNESFVCIDSRTPGGRDLMDKEMAYLIWRTFKKKPGTTTVFITDCCHSGSITREALDESDVTDRMMSANQSFPASVKDYYGYGVNVDDEAGYITSDDGSRVTVKAANHIHIAASRDNQTSKELSIEGKKHGAFTHSLLKTLYNTGGLISYRELAQTAGALVKGLVSSQDPDVTPCGELKDEALDKIFLSNTDVKINPKFLVYRDPQFGWCLKAGKFHGVTEGDEVIIDEVGETIVTGSPSPDFSVIRGIDKLEEGKVYHASVVRQPNQPLTLSFSPDFPGELRTLIHTASTENDFPFIAISLDKPGQYVIRSKDNNVFITLPGIEQPVFQPMQVAANGDAITFLAKIETVSKWKNLRELTNASSQLTSRHYTIKLFRNKNADTDNDKNYDEVVPLQPVNDFHYKESDGQWAQPAFRLSITNHTNNLLWVTGVYLGFDFAVYADYFQAVPVAANSTAWLTVVRNSVGKDIIKLVLEKKYANKGYSEITEYLKVFISTDKIKTSGLGQEGIELAAAFRGDFEEANLRGLGDDDDEISLSRTEWKAETIGIRVIKPLPVVDISPDKSISVQGITIQKHGSLKASASLSSSGHTSRSADGVPPPHLARKNSGIEPFDLRSAGTSENVTDVLELFDVQNPEAVTEESPLIIVPTVTRSATDEPVIPIGFDSETGLYYPLGYTDENGQIIINTLPDATSSDSAITQRSFVGSIKIYFQKVIAQKLGLKYDYPRLAVVTVDEKGNVAYNHDNDFVSQKVQNASNIVLFVHGIIGDTEGMVKCIKTPLNGNGETLEKKYNLVLSFDYENLNTKIEENAALLKKRLDDVGIKEDDGKNLTIMAHSMGGLVSRWFIEKLNGRKVVDELRMFGTPNNGTPWADVRDLAETLLTYAINGAAFLKPWMLVLSGVFKLVKGTQIALKQMDSKTGIYKELNDGTDPLVPYTIFVGNTQKIIVDYGKTSALITKLFIRLKKRGVYDALDAVLFHKPNDIAVSNDSISTLGNSANWKPAPVVKEVACDHMNYFNGVAL